MKRMLVPILRLWCRLRGHTLFVDPIVLGFSPAGHHFPCRRCGRPVMVRLGNFEPAAAIIDGKLWLRRNHS